MGINIATVTKECTLLWEYLFDQWNANLAVMESVSHWIISLCGSLSLLHLCFLFPILKNLWSLLRGQGFEKSVCKLEEPVGELGPSLCPAVTPCSVKCPSSALQAKALWFCDVPLLMPEEGCSVAPSKLFFYEQYWIPKARKHKAMGIV